VTRPKAERLESLTVDVPLSPRQAFMGGQMRILVPARKLGAKGGQKSNKIWRYFQSR
jgi:hypothetical protein